MLPLRIELSRHENGHCVLRCTRPDGTQTWQKQRGNFFALHDLTHFVVETTLGLDGGFYGLVLEGWNITDFGSPWPRGPIPDHAIDDAALAEHVVGLLDQERAGGTALGASAFNDTLADGFAQRGQPLPRRLTPDELARIRYVVATLTRRWLDLPEDTTMTLFYPGPASQP